MDLKHQLSLSPGNRIFDCKLEAFTLTDDDRVIKRSQSVKFLSLDCVNPISRAEARLFTGTARNHLAYCHCVRGRGILVVGEAGLRGRVLVLNDPEDAVGDGGRGE